MPSPGIFQIQPDGQLLELTESRYDSEAILQEFIAKHPSLLAGDQVDSESPRRWLLIKRELGIPGGENEASRWSVDHLLLDQDGVPTLVEIKRSTDTRIRREVVGQMLDYAANAIAYWPAERLQHEFEARLGDKAEATLSEFLGPEIAADEFWSKAKTNLLAGKLRLLFVADAIPPELRRIIEFLNQQMDPVEVLGVEIRQFTGGGVTSLIPRVIGQTAEAERRKSSPSPKKKWDEASFFSVLAARGREESATARKILDWSRSQNLRIWWGQGARDGSFYPMIDHANRAQYTIGVRTGATNGYVQLQLPQMTPPFDDITKRAEFLSRLEEKTGWHNEVGEKYPRLFLSKLAEPSATEGFLEVLDWVVSETRRS